MNYIESKSVVKYSEGIHLKSQEWQWLIDELQKNFEIKEIHSWEQYKSERIRIVRVFEYFIKILGVCDKEWIFSKEEFREIWIVAKFYVGSYDVAECTRILTHEQCKLFFFCIWIMKSVNNDNDLNFTHYFDLLELNNYFQLIKCDSLLDIKDELLEYADNIPVDGLDVPMNILYNNLNQEEFHYNKDNDLIHKKEILKYNAFSYQNIYEKDCQTWQEKYLLDMLQISFDEKETFLKEVRWDEKVLYGIKIYFDCKIADFVVETIGYMSFETEPSKEIKLLHCKLLIKAFNKGEEIDNIISSSSYFILAYLHQDKLMNDCKREKKYIELLKIIQGLDNPTLIANIKEHGYPVSKKQKEIYAECIRNEYKKIDDVNKIKELNDYLVNKTIARNINKEYLQRVNVKIEECTEKNLEFIIADLYYKYMQFLDEVYNNRNVDKEYVQTAMINIQKNWQERIYPKLCEKLPCYIQEQVIDEALLQQDSDRALKDPLFMANKCTPTSEKEMLKMKEANSQEIFSQFAENINFNPIFPMEKEIDYEKHDVDKNLLQYLEDLEQKRGRNALNKFKKTKYLSNIHDTYKTNTKKELSLFTREEDLYNTVKEEAPIELISYSKEISLASLTQLFPVLEIEIRKLAILFNIFPFKKNNDKSKHNNDKFMQNNDPSSLLRDILNQIYDEQRSFEMVPDLIFVYNIMYNTNSYNIRNECVHGRDFLVGDKLRFAFRATLFAIHMVAFRIKKSNDGDKEST